MSTALTWALLAAITPGVSAFVENVMHVLQDGHLAHHTVHEGAASDESEHGCAAAMHVCACHAALAATLACTAESLSPPDRGTWAAPSCDRGPPSLSSEGLFRPPRA